MVIIVEEQLTQYTVKLLLNAGSLIDAGASDARVLINAGSQINAGDAEVCQSASRYIT